MIQNKVKGDANYGIFQKINQKVNEWSVGDNPEQIFATFCGSCSPKFVSINYKLEVFC